MKRIAAIILMIFTYLFGVFSCFIPTTLHASADTTVYTNVLDDLKQDENFLVENYPANPTDYSLQVITVAEGANAQLFVYVYQPSYVTKPLQASSINISTTLYSQLSFKNYKLNLVNLDGMFQKYVVDGLVVSSDSSRAYQISSIFRTWDSTIDKEADRVTENWVEEVSYKVAKRYVFEQNGIYSDLTVSDVETIEITRKFVGFIRYHANSVGYITGYDKFDVHFVAFSTDRKIDELLEADVYYETQSYASVSVGLVDTDTFGKRVSNISELRHDKDIKVSGDGWFSLAYNWGSIVKSDVFLTETNSSFVYEQGFFDTTVTTEISDEDKKAYIASCNWVLRFAVTEYSYSTFLDVDNVRHTLESSTKVDNVTILRLFFKTDGFYYNLGVIDNKQTGSSTPVGQSKVEVELSEEWWQKLLSVILLVLLVVIFWPVLLPIVSGILKLILKGLWLLLKGLFKLLFQILFFPFRLLFGGRNKRER